ncbi:hypothetical protein Tco_1315729 [Tanacetum coccineum]
MPSEYQQDYKKTHAYALKIYNDPNMSDEHRDIYRTLASRYVHEGRTIDSSFYNDLSDDLVAKFTAIGIYIYSDAWGLDELEKTLEQIEPYNSRLSALDDIRNLIHRRTAHERVNKEGKTIHKLPNQIETNELFNHLRPCELVIRENVYFSKSSTSLRCLFIEWRKSKTSKMVPCHFAMLLTRLYNHILQTNPQAILLARFTFHEHLMDPLDISRNPSKEKGKKIISSSVISSSSSSSNDNEAPSFLEFYDELSDSEDLTKS